MYVCLYVGIQAQISVPVLVMQASPHMYACAYVDRHVRVYAFVFSCI